MRPFTVAIAARIRTPVDVRTRGRAERWGLTFDDMWPDLIRLPLDAAGLVLRANIVEWWDTRLAESTPQSLTAERIT